MLETPQEQNPPENLRNNSRKCQICPIAINQCTMKMLKRAVGFFKSEKNENKPGGTEKSQLCISDQNAWDYHFWHP